MKVYRVDPAGPVIVGRQGVVGIVGETWGEAADLLVMPDERLAPEFFRLSGLAGEMLQQFVD